MHKPILLITGADGFTGRHAFAFFQDYHVIGVSRKKDPTKNMFSADLTNEEDVNRLVQMTKPDMILHLAGQNHVQTSWKEPVSTIKSNFMSTLHLLSAVRQHSLKTKVLVVGSALQSTDSYPHPYSYSKSLQGELTKVWQDFYGGNAIFVKATNLIGPGPSSGVCANIARRIVEIENGNVASVLSLENKRVTRDYVDVRDAIRAYNLILKKGNPEVEYKIGTGKMFSLEEIVSVFRELSKKPFTVEFAESKLDQSQLLSSFELKRLGWKQEIDIRTSFEDTLRYFREVQRREGGDGI